MRMLWLVGLVAALCVAQEQDDVSQMRRDLSRGQFSLEQQCRDVSSSRSLFLVFSFSFFLSLAFFSKKKKKMYFFQPLFVFAGSCLP